MQTDLQDGEIEKIETTAEGESSMKITTKETDGIRRF